MQCQECLRIFQTFGDTLNAPIETTEVLQCICTSIVENLSVKGCQIFLLSRNQSQLEHIASLGLSEKFSVREPLVVEGMTLEVLQGNIVTVADCPSDPRLHRFPVYGEEGIKSLLIIPLKSRGQVIGAMHISTAEERVFSSDELEITRVAAALCASVILRSMFQKILHDVSEAVPLSLDIHEAVQQIVRVIAEDLRAKGCLIRLLDPNTGRLELWASYGLSQAYLDVGPRDASKASEELRAGKCVAVFDAPQYLQYPEEARREGIASMLSIPLLVHKCAIGFLRVYTHRPYEFSADEIHLMKIVGDQCALLIQNAQLYQSVKDRYDRLVVDFHNWFDQFYGPGGIGTRSAV
jgi:two-component system NtrC family sensor kinase